MTRYMFAIILVVVLMFAGCGRQDSSRSAVDKAGQQVSLSDVQRVATGPEQKIKDRDLSAGIYGRDDPFAPVSQWSTTSVRRKKGELKLDGVITGPGEPLAMINDEILKQGDIIEGKRIINIDIESVTLEDDSGKRYILKAF